MQIHCSPFPGKRVDSSHQLNMDLLDQMDRKRDWFLSHDKSLNHFHSALNTFVLTSVDFMLVQTTSPVETDPIVADNPVPIALVIGPRYRNKPRRTWFSEDFGKLSNAFPGQLSL